MNRSLMIFALGILAFGGGFIFTYNSPEDQDSTSIVSTSSPVTSAENTSQKPILSSGGQWRWDEVKQDWVPNVSHNKPSDRALKAVSQVYVYADSRLQKEFTKNYAGENGSASEAIRNLALILDNNPEQLALMEADIMKYMNSLSSKREYQIPSWSGITCRTYSYQYSNSITTNCY